VQTYLFESVADPFVRYNWGAFLVAVPDEIEWGWRSHAIPGDISLPEQLAWGPSQAWVMDLRTGEGALFSLGGDYRAELESHRIFVTAQFEGFLEWLCLQDPAGLRHLPHVVKVADATFSIRNYRRLGPTPVSFTLRKGDTFDMMWAGEPRTVTCDGSTDGGVLIRDLTEDEMRQLMTSPEDQGEPEPGPESESGPEEKPQDGESAEDEPHELDYEEMREGPPPGISEFPDDADDTTDTPDATDATAVIPVAEAATETLPAAATARRARRR
jgi:hypothetical protein